MESIAYTSSQSNVINFITNINKNYEVWIDFKDEVRYIDPDGMIIKQSVQNPLKVTYSDINPIYKVYKKSKNIYTLKIIIPEFSIIFTTFHNLTYTFKENSLNLNLNLANFNISYYDIENYFDHGIEQYLKRTIESIMTERFRSDNNYSLRCTNYKTYVYGIKQNNKKRKNNLTYIY